MKESKLEELGISLDVDNGVGGEIGDSLIFQLGGLVGS